MKTATFYHVESPLCVDFRLHIVDALDPAQYEVVYVNLAKHHDRIVEAEHSGVKTVPALVIENHAYNINSGIPIQEIRAWPAELLQHGPCFSSAFAHR